MKKFLVYALSLTLLVGCFSLPSAKQSAAEKKTAQIEQSISKNEDFRLEAIKSYNYGVQYSLSLESNPSKNVQVAQNLNDKSLVISGPPSFKNAEDFKQIVNGLVSTNKTEVTKSENDLRLRDLQVIRLQAELGGLNAKLGVQEDKNLQLARENSNLGDFLARIKHWLFWIGIVIAVLIVIHLLSFLPAPYGNVFSLVAMIFGMIGRFIFKAVPKAATFAKVVGSNTKIALDDVVASIEEVKDKHPEVFETIKPILKSNTSKEISRPIIDLSIQEQKV